MEKIVRKKFEKGFPQSLWELVKIGDFVNFELVLLYQDFLINLLHILGPPKKGLTSREKVLQFKMR